MRKEKITVGSCFSGIGGLELGLEWTGGFETKWQIENDPYASAVLKKHWPNVKKYTDIQNVVRPGYVDLICGGFPCQDISNAGRRAGLSGERSGLWREMVRTFRLVRPRFVLVENVAALLGRGMGTVLGDLAESGYDTEWNCLSACSVGAPHTRKRVFVIANSARAEVRYRFDKNGTRKPNETFRFGKRDWWATEPNVPRVAHGIPSQLDRRRCLGNSIVPQVAQKVGQMILDYAHETY